MVAAARASPGPLGAAAALPGKTGGERLPPGRAAHAVLSAPAAAGAPAARRPRLQPGCWRCRPGGAGRAADLPRAVVCESSSGLRARAGTRRARQRRWRRDAGRWRPPPGAARDDGRRGSEAEASSAHAAIHDAAGAAAGRPRLGRRLSSSAIGSAIAIGERSDVMSAPRGALAPGRPGADPDPGQAHRATPPSHNRQPARARRPRGRRRRQHVAQHSARIGKNAVQKPLSAALRQPPRPQWHRRM